MMTITVLEALVRALRSLQDAKEASDDGLVDDDIEEATKHIAIAVDRLLQPMLPAPPASEPVERVPEIRRMGSGYLFNGMLYPEYGSARLARSRFLAAAKPDDEHDDLA